MLYDLTLGRVGPLGGSSFVCEMVAEIVVDCFHAKPRAEVIVPMSTAFAKSSLTVTNVTNEMMNKSRFGTFPNNLNEPHENVDWQTNNMTPASATTGICPNNGAQATMPNAKNIAMDMPERRLTPPPLWALMRDWPMRAHPPIPPVRPDARLPIPWPMTSRLVLPRFPSSMIPSRSWRVRRDSIDPTAAMVIAYGRIILSVSKGAFTNGVQTDDGSPIFGNTDNPPLNVSAPATSASVFNGHLKTRAMIEVRTTPPKVGGTALAAFTFSCSLGIPRRTRAIVRRVQP
mmetsp:Transcript_29738/g.64042  ORF Transcript_29738/g.64042 Transcript_29738/m.64042 type:complete len:287 (+) Transcript_29738:1905-2765(+)